jgi:hypothetical protein
LQQPNFPAVQATTEQRHDHLPHHHLDGKRRKQMQWICTTPLQKMILLGEKHQPDWISIPILHGQ